MKIAFNFSGFVRNFQMHRANILANMPEGADIFLHSWNFKSQNDRLLSDSEILNVLNALRPRDFLFYHNDQLLLIAQKIDEIWSYKREHITSHFPSNYFYMWASIYFSNLLRKLFEKKYNYSYDLVVRHRFDFSFKNTFNYDKLNPDVLNVLPINREDGLCDIWAAANPKIINIYSDIFNNFNECCHAIKLMRPEDMLKYWVEKHNIKINIIREEYFIK